MVELIYYALIVWGVACFLGSLWGLFDPFSFARFMRNISLPIGALFWLSAAAVWCALVGKGVAAFLPDMGMVMDEAGEYIQRKEGMGELIGCVVGFFGFGAVVKLRYESMVKQERDREG
jgi:hypothetical protein